MRDATDRPNIILINCDDLGYGDLQCYGSPCNRTPHLDRLANEGTRFTDFCMASSVCSPSRAAMMTGSLPRRIGFGVFSSGKLVLFPGDAEGLNPAEVTLPSLLQREGYATALVGKWHCGDQPEFLPTRHGFDHYFGIPYSNDMGRQGGARREKNFPPLPLLCDDEVIQEQPEQSAITERYTDESLRFMRQHRDEPFFLYLAHMYVHRPLIVPAPFLSRSQNGRYGAAVECIDWSTGTILHELRRLGIEENTIVIFTSDNGSRAWPGEGGSNAPLRGQKASSWEGGFRVPMAVRWPGQIPAGRVSSALCSSLDFLPTLARLAGTQAPDDRPLDGCDLASLWRGEVESSPRETFVYYHRDELRAVRHGPWKLHVHFGPEMDPRPPRLLYNLREDIGEQRDVSSEHPDVVRQLEAIADAYRADLGDAATQASGSHCRPIGLAKSPRCLTGHDPDYPYFVAEYDLEDAG